MRNGLVITLLTIIGHFTGFSQDLTEADAMFESQNFEGAMAVYEETLEKEYNSQIAYKLAICYLNTFIDKSKAIPILEKLKQDEHPDPNTLYLLGRAYHFNGEFEKAIAAYSAFIKEGKGNADNIKNAGKQVEYCENARELMKFPVNVQIKNLGQKVNSNFSDYYPFVPANESCLIFNSKRNDGSDFRLDGSFHSNVYICRVENGEFTHAEVLSGEINSPFVSEEIVGMNSTGDKAVVYVDDELKKSELRIITIDNMEVVKSEKLPKEINTMHHEIAASINNEGNEIYFASDKPGGYGGIDIYVVRKMPNGKWGKPQNLGPAVNTAYDEDFPNISPDGKTLYFSSKGHASMGGYDIFVAKWDDEKIRFVRASNFGYPVNTTGDDMNFRISENGRYGYMSYALNGQGSGDWDIYRITFLDVEPEVTVVNGKIILPEGFDWTSISITVTNQNGELVGEYVPNKTTLRYVIALSPGKYNLTVKTAGLETHKETLQVLDKVSHQPLIEKDIVLKK